MRTRRSFLKHVSTLATGLGLGAAQYNRWMSAWTEPLLPSSPIQPHLLDSARMISTWNHGMPANEAGMRVGLSGGSALDMVEVGARLVESDAEGQSVGLGGLPDRDGRVTLDACIMDHQLNAGSVCFVQNFEHPITIARKVMEDTPHVMLAGAGAEAFAKSLGMPPRELLTPDSELAYQTWLKESRYDPIINIENHDTISLLAIDQAGKLAGACTTSGLAYKMHGRVGDSPIIGAGLYVDGEVAAAAATGLGEAVMRTLGSFLVVELIRGGQSAQSACEEGIARIQERMATDDLQVGYIAMDRSGETGAHAIHPGFSYALHVVDQGKVNGRLVDSTHG